MLALVAKAITTVWQSNTFSMEKIKEFITKQPILSELKGNYTDNQAHT